MIPTLRLNLSADVIECNQARRIIAGRIVPFGDAVGHTSVGPVQFTADSIEFASPSDVKLLLEHDNRQPIGRALAIETRPDGMYATFSIARTTRGDDALVEAADGLRSGLSVGVEVKASKPVDGVLVVAKSTLREVSLVESPAFTDAVVTNVAASQPDETEQPEPSTEGTEMSEQLTPAEVTAPTVEASTSPAPVIQAAAPIFTEVRHGIKTPGNLVEHTLKAALGDHESAQWVKAASDGTPTEWAGLIPTPQLGTVFNGKTTGVRPAVEAISQETLPAYGMTFEIPRIKTATTAAVAAAGGAFSDTQGEIEYLSVDVKKIAGMQLADVEVIYRSTPAYFDELARLMGDAFAAAQDGLVTAALIAGGTQDTTTITLGWDGDEIAGFVSRAAASIYAGSKRFPTGIVMTPDQWALWMAVNDTTKRPLFNLNGDSVNGMGALNPSAPVGRALGLPVYVDPHLATTTVDNSIIVVNREAYTFYEGPRAELRADTVGTGKVSIGYFSFAAVATKAGAGAFRFNLT